MISWRYASIVTLAVMLSLVVPDDVRAQSLRTEHTYKLDDDESRPPATLDDVSWLAGSWSGEALRR